MTEATGETIDQGFADLDAGQDDIEAKLDALTAEETKELAFLAQLETQRGEGQLAPDQQARLDDLKARQAAVSAALAAATEELAQADGSEPAIGRTPTPSAPGGDPIGTPLVPVDGEPAPVGDPSGETDVPVSEAGDGNATGAAPVATEDPGDEPASNAD